MFDFIIFLILGSLALLFRWLTNQASDKSEKPVSPRADEPPSRGPAESEEERVRRFLEALGVPAGTAPPPPVKPRPVRPRRVVTPQQPTPPRKVRRSFVRPLPPLVTTPEGPPPPPLTSAPAAPPIGFEEAAVSAPLVSPFKASVTFAPGIVRQTGRPLTMVASLSSLGVLLRSRDSVRQAIILREVLGPARGLQPLAQTDLF
jgi:hypothetical protein